MIIVDPFSLPNFSQLDYDPIMFAILLKNPLGGCAYLVAILAIISMWIRKEVWIWGLLFVCSYSLAYYSEIASVKTLIPVTIIVISFIALKEPISGFLRLFAALIGAIVSMGFLTHLIAGFQNIRVLSVWKSAPNALPINLYLNYDKIILAICILGLYLPLIRSKKEFYHTLIKTVPWLILTALALLGLSTYLKIIKVDLKIPFITPLWLIVQLFCVVIPEEAFYRGFMQREIARNLNNRAAGTLAVLVTSLIFTGAHIFFIRDPAFLVVVFLSGIFYGAIYQMTKAIESSIFVHYMVNILHFFFFTYPMLAP